MAWASRFLAMLVLLGLLLLCWWPRPAWGTSTGSQLFENHCVGCHVNGGNIIRRGRTLRLSSLRRNGIEGPEAIAAIASGGLGQMSGYGEALGPGGAEAVGQWVWDQALRDWKRES
jgi:cytochrome c6